MRSTCAERPSATTDVSVLTLQASAADPSASQEHELTHRITVRGGVPLLGAEGLKRVVERIPDSSPSRVKV